MRSKTRTLWKLGAAVAILATTLAPPASANHQQPFDGPLHVFGQKVDYPMVFPVQGPNTFGNHFWAARSGGIHHGIDIMAAKMTPVVAIADGTITYLNGSGNQSWIDKYGRCCTLRITHADGWVSKYIHLNNDTPGTDDGKGWGIAPGIALGVKVTAGQLIGWVGDSGNAENTAPHLHFELMDKHGVIVDPYLSLRAAATGTPVTGIPVSGPSCSSTGVGSLSTLLGSTTLIKMGSRGTEVRELQQFLRAVGHSPGPVDGVAGFLTAGAIRAFQTARGVPADGVVGAVTRNHIRQMQTILPAIPVLDAQNRIIRLDDRGADVKRVQELLKAAGYDPGPLDGVYGPKTVAAVAAFQKSYGSLTVDGKTGPQTRNALASFLGLGSPRSCT